MIDMDIRECFYILSTNGESHTIFFNDIVITIC